MTLDLSTLATRARGLATHQLPRAELEALARAPDPFAFGRALARDGRMALPIDVTQGIEGLEAVVRATSAQRLSTLARWAQGSVVLDVIFGDLDRLSLRALARGALQGAKVEARLAGLVPTPRLPVRALAELARAPTPAALAAQLAVRRHPDAPALVVCTARALPSPIEIEVALLRGWASRAVVAARDGDEALRAYVGLRVDACNAALALSLSRHVVEGAPELEPSRGFVDGGRELARGVFVKAATAASRSDAWAALTRGARRTELAGLLRDARGDPARIDRAFLARALRRAHREATLRPLGSGGVLLFLLREIAQCHDLRRLAWGATLGAPPSIVLPELVTPWR